LSQYDKVVDNLAYLSNITPTVLNVSTMMDVTSSSFDDFDKVFEKKKEKVIKLLMKFKHREQWFVCVPP
jgi:hypothetical protein